MAKDTTTGGQGLVNLFLDLSKIIFFLWPQIEHLDQNPHYGLPGPDSQIWTNPFRPLQGAGQEILVQIRRNTISGSPKHLLGMLEFFFEGGRGRGGKIAT